jgi:hypothetical protein
MYVDGCMHVCRCVNIYEYVYMNIHISTYTCIYICMYISTYICIYIYKYIYLYMHVQKYILMYLMHMRKLDEDPQTNLRNLHSEHVYIYILCIY